MKKFKLLALVLALALSFSLVACSPAETETPAESTAPAESSVEEEAMEEEMMTWDIPEGAKIGISLPSGSDSEVWQVAEKSFEKVIGGAGYELDIQWAGNNAATQVQQIESMIVNGCRALIVLPHDDSALNSAVATAREEGILVINYDLALRGTDQVDYFVGFDNRQVGTLQGEYIVEALGLDEGAEGPFNIELFAGSLSELNCYYYFDTAMEVLQPYIDSGVLVIQSGQTDIETCTVTDWNYELLNTRLESLITAYYSDGEVLHAVLSPTDGISQRVVPLLENFGYGSDIDMPVITGNNGNISVLKYVASGDIGMTIYKGRDPLAEDCLYIIQQAGKGEEIEYSELYTPNDFEFKTLFGEMVVVTADNLDAEIIDKGVYTEEEVYSAVE